MRGFNRVRALLAAAALAGLVSTVAKPAAGQQQSGERPPFQAVVEALLETIADPTPDRVRQFSERHLAPAYRQSEPLESHAARAREMRAAIGRAELLELVFDTPGERRALVRSGVDGQPYVMLFRVTDDMPPRIAGVTLEARDSGGASADGSAAPGGTAAAVKPDDRLRQLLDIAFTAAPEAAEAWVREAYAPSLLDRTRIAQHLNVLGQIRDEARDVEVVSVTSQSPARATALYRSRLTGEWRQLEVEVEPHAPNRLTAVDRPQLIAPPPAHTPERRTFSAVDARQALDTYARRLADADLFSGAVLVSRGGEVLFHDAYGAASREFGVANTTTTRFSLGSINKMFTTVGILQLVEKGKLSLKDRVSQHLPGVLPEGVAAKIRIEHLLTHTSGLGDFLFTPQMQGRARQNYRTIADYLPLLADTTLRFEPGSSWGYSNAGFLVLGAILERVSGVPYDEYVQRNVFDPAGMTDTGAPDMDLVPTGVAGAYEREFDAGRPRLRSDRYVRPVRGTPAGGGFSTAMDLFRFVTAVRSHRLLSPDMTRLMLSAKPELGSKNYGFGTQIFSPDGTRFGHTGGGMGTGAIVEYDAASDLLLVVLGNMNTGALSVVSRARQVYGTGAPRQSW